MGGHLLQSYCKRICIRKKTVDRTAVDSPPWNAKPVNNMP